MEHSTKSITILTVISVDRLTDLLIKYLDYLTTWLKVKRFNRLKRHGKMALNGH
jgi:hypothetical protein